MRKTAIASSIAVAGLAAALIPASGTIAAPTTPTVTTEAVQVQYTVARAFQGTGGKITIAAFNEGGHVFGYAKITDPRKGVKFELEGLVTCYANLAPNRVKIGVRVTAAGGVYDIGHSPGFLVVLEDNGLTNNNTIWDYASTGPLPTVPTDCSIDDSATTAINRGDVVIRTENLSPVTGEALATVTPQATEVQYTAVRASFVGPRKLTVAAFSEGGHAFGFVKYAMPSDNFVMVGQVTCYAKIAPSRVKIGIKVTEIKGHAEGWTGTEPPPGFVLVIRDRGLRDPNSELTPDAMGMEARSKAPTDCSRPGAVPHGNFGRGDAVIRAESIG